MKLTPVVLIFPVAAVIGFFAAEHWLRPAEPPPAVTSQSNAPVLTLPEFSLKNRDGQMQSIRSWPGKALLINFWATWCAPCRQEIPMLIAMQSKHAADGLQVVGIAVDFRDDVLNYADAMKITYPLLIGEQDGLAAVDAFGIQSVGFPYSVFVDARNNIVSTYIGELKTHQVEAALAIIERINRGDLPLGPGRTEVATTLAQLKSDMVQH